MHNILKILTDYRQQQGPHPMLNRAIAMLYQKCTAAERQVRFTRMTTPEGFKHLFYETIKQQHCTHQQAFDQINDEYFTTAGKYRYKNYNSFKAVKDR